MMQPAVHAIRQPLKSTSGHALPPPRLHLVRMWPSRCNLRAVTIQPAAAADCVKPPDPPPKIPQVPSNQPPIKRVCLCTCAASREFVFRPLVAVPKAGKITLVACETATLWQVAAMDGILALANLRRGSASSPRPTRRQLKRFIFRFGGAC